MSGVIDVLIAIAVAVAASIATFALQTRVSMSSSDAERLNDHIKQISMIEAYSTEYWSTGRKENGAAKENLLAARVNGSMSASSYFNSEARRILGSRYEKYVEIDQALYDAATGGDFEIKDRSADFQRVVVIMSLANEMRSLLMTARRSVFGVH